MLLILLAKTRVARVICMNIPSVEFFWWRNRLEHLLKHLIQVKGPVSLYS